MKSHVIAAVMLAAVAAVPVDKAAAQNNVLNGAVLGGIGGGVLGGLLSGGRGAGIAIGAVLGAGTGAVIAAQGQRRRNGYYAYQEGCWLQRRDGDWVRVADRYCY